MITGQVRVDEDLQHPGHYVLAVKLEFEWAKPGAPAAVEHLCSAAMTELERLINTACGERIAR